MTSLGEPERRAWAGRHCSNWAATLKLPTVKPELVLRSALTLKGLAHHDTGATMATATILLPYGTGDTQSGSPVVSPRRGPVNLGRLQEAP
jgi:hypothetical protein